MIIQPNKTLTDKISELDKKVNDLVKLIEKIAVEKGAEQEPNEPRPEILPSVGSDGENRSGGEE